MISLKIEREEPRDEEMMRLGEMATDAMAVERPILVADQDEDQVGPDLIFTLTFMGEARLKVKGMQTPNYLGVWYHGSSKIFVESCSDAFCRIFN